LGGYRLVRRIGAGSYGHVWLGHRAVDGRFHAVKIVPEGPAGEAERAGLAALGALGPIEGVVPVFDVTHDPDRGCLSYAMPLADDVNGPATIREPGAYQPLTLERFCLLRRPLPIDDAIGVAAELLSPLGRLHRRGFVYRDVKPSNVLRIEERWHLGDPGLLRRRDHISHHGKGGGTRGYVPDEGATEQRADLFAVGQILARLVTGPGVTEFEPGSEWAIPGTDPRRHEFQKVIEKACQRQADQRHQTSEELLAEISAFGRRPSRAATQRGDDEEAAAAALPVESARDVYAKLLLEAMRRTNNDVVRAQELVLTWLHELAYDSRVGRPFRPERTSSGP
jgi:serine/threonine protein kinase